MRRGFAVDVAEDGRIASSLIERRHYDVIFSDLQMPNMGGMALLDWIRTRQPGSSSAFVFVMGGLPSPELQATADRAHIPVLSKPFGVASVDNVLQVLFADPLNA